MGYQTIRMAVNISSYSIKEDLVDTIKEILKKDPITAMLFRVRDYGKYYADS